jgi:hypothetical protein
MPHHDTAFCRRVRAARWGVHLAFRRHSIYLQLNVGQQNGSVASAFRFDRGPSVWLVSPLMEAGQPYAWMQLYTERTWRGDCGVALARAANQLNLPRTPAGFGVIAPCIAASEHVMLITHVVLYIQKASETGMYKRWSLFTLWRSCTCISSSVLYYFQTPESLLVWRSNASTPRASGCSHWKGIAPMCAWKTLWQRLV